PRRSSDLRASLQRLRQRAQRIENFLREEQAKQGARGHEVQSNVTDNDSAKMQTGHGVIQGYNAQALVDERHQIIVHAVASGTGQDHQQLASVLGGAQELLELAALSQELPLREAKLSADCNYHREANLKACEEQGVAACSL